ncbi:MAG: hypothetical protein PHY16_05300 [Methylobacter sp.]|nr:hypothetical protein [Methylobacter sp.]
MMKKYIRILSLTASFFILSAHADVALKDNSEILGKWKLYAEAAKLEGEKKAVTIEWDFKEDGVLQTKATDSVGRTKEMSIAVKYSVADGEIKKQVSPGREKYESCKVVEKNGSNMVLKCTYLFFFLTKI